MRKEGWLDTNLRLTSVGHGHIRNVVVVDTDGMEVFQLTDAMIRSASKEVLIDIAELLEREKSNSYSRGAMDLKERIRKEVHELLGIERIVDALGHIG